MHTFESPLPKLGRDELSEIQMAKFRAGLETILETNAFYRRKFKEAGVDSHQEIRSIDEYRSLPFTTKEELSQDQAENPIYGSNLTYEVRRYTHVHQTSGTKGDPLRWLDDDESWSWWSRCWSNVYRAAGLTSQDRIFFAFSFGPFIGFWSAFGGANSVGALAIPGGGMSSLQRLKAIQTHRATVVVCTPTYALHLAEVAADEGIDLRGSSVGTTIHAGEPGASLPHTKARIERLWGAKCYDHAGATEVGAWGYEGPYQNGLFVNEGEFLCQVVCPETGSECDEGELVLSNLGRVGSPVIRYRTGDRVRLAADPCPSGCGFRRLEGGVIGRVDDVMVVRGINIYPSAIENMVRRIPEIGEFAVDIRRRRELDELQIRVEVSSAHRDSVALLAREMRSALGLRVTVEPVDVGSLPRFDLKARRFKDHRG